VKTSHRDVAVRKVVLQGGVVSAARDRVRPARAPCPSSPVRFWRSSPQDHCARAGPQPSEDRTRAQGAALTPDIARFGSRLPWLRDITALGEPNPPALQHDES
jgi:hypothetical protein